MAENGKNVANSQKWLKMWRTVKMDENGKNVAHS